MRAVVLAIPLKSILQSLTFQKHLIGGEEGICHHLTTCRKPKNAALPC